MNGVEFIGFEGFIFRVILNGYEILGKIKVVVGKRVFMYGLIVGYFMNKLVGFDVSIMVC